MKILLEININGEKVSARVIPMQGKKPQRAVANAVSWLQNYMENGPRQSAEVFFEASEAGINRNALYKAKKILGIKHYPVGYRAKDGWTWEREYYDKQTDMAQSSDRVESDLDPQRKTLLGVAFGNGLQDWEKSGGTDIGDGSIG
jgi:hypothetical protein